jgi:hypothetical protein
LETQPNIKYPPTNSNAAQKRKKKKIAAMTACASLAWSLLMVLDITLKS